MRRIRAGSLVLFLALAALSGARCTCAEEQPLSLPEPEPPPIVPIAAPRGVSTPASFDLVTGGRGAVLVYGPPSKLGGGVRALALDENGDKWGREHALVNAGEPGAGTRETGTVTELAAAAGGGRIGVVWLVHERLDTRIFTALGDAAGLSFGPPKRIAIVRDIPLAKRGQIAIAASPEGQISLLHRGAPEQCTDQPGACVQFLGRRLGDGGEDGRIPMLVPSPCDHGLTGYVYSAGVWYFGLCNEPDKNRATTLYAIQFEPEYAHAERILFGAEPMGLIPVPNGVVAVGERNGKLRAVTVEEAGKRVASLGSGVRRTVRCEGKRPVLGIVGEEGRRWR